MSEQKLRETLQWVLEAALHSKLQVCDRCYQHAIALLREPEKEKLPTHPNEASYWKEAFEIATKGGRSFQYQSWGGYYKTKYQTEQEWRAVVLEQFKDYEREGD